MVKYTIDVDVSNVRNIIAMFNSQANVSDVNGLVVTAETMRRLAKQLKEQADADDTSENEDEPTRFGSMVRSQAGEIYVRAAWSRSGDRVWIYNTGLEPVRWDEIERPKVLRSGTDLSNGQIESLITRYVSGLCVASRPSSVAPLVRKMLREVGW